MNNPQMPWDAFIFSTIARDALCTKHFDRLDDLSVLPWHHKAAAYAGHAHYLIAATAPALMVAGDTQCRRSHRLVKGWGVVDGVLPGSTVQQLHPSTSQTSRLTLSLPCPIARKIVRICQDSSVYCFRIFQACSCRRGSFLFKQSFEAIQFRSYSALGKLTFPNSAGECSCIVSSSCWCQ